MTMFVLDPLSIECFEIERRCHREFRVDRNQVIDAPDLTSMAGAEVQS
jgi:hypothetical protein